MSTTESDEVRKKIESVLEELLCVPTEELLDGDSSDLEPFVSKIMALLANEIQAAVKVERDRWAKASMQRLAKYDETSIPPETQALIQAATADILDKAIALFDMAAFNPAGTMFDEHMMLRTYEEIEEGRRYNRDHSWAAMSAQEKLEKFKTEYLAQLQSPKQEEGR